MKKVIGLMMTILVVTGVWCQAETPWNLALVSEPALKSYCLEKSNRAYIGIWGGDDVVAISNANQSVWVYSQDSLKLAEKVSGQSLGVGVVTGSEETLVKSCYFYRYNKENDYIVTFSGWSEGKILQLGDSKSLVWKDLEMKLPDEVVIDLPEEYDWGYVYLRYVDENGNTQYIYLGSGSCFEFPKAFPV